MKLTGKTRFRVQKKRWGGYYMVLQLEWTHSRWINCYPYSKDEFEWRDARLEDINLESYETR